MRRDFILARFYRIFVRLVKMALIRVRMRAVHYCTVHYCTVHYCTVHYLKNQTGHMTQYSQSQACILEIMHSEQYNGFCWLDILLLNVINELACDLRVVNNGGR